MDRCRHCGDEIRLNVSQLMDSAWLSCRDHSTYCSEARQGSHELFIPDLTNEKAVEAWLSQSS